MLYLLDQCLSSIANRGEPLYFSCVGRLVFLVTKPTLACGMTAITTASVYSASARPASDAMGPGGAGLHPRARAKDGSSQGSSHPGARFSSTEVTVGGQGMRGLNSGRLHQFENAAAAMAGTSRMVIGRNNEARSSAGSNAAARAVSAVADTTAGTSPTALKTSGGKLAAADSSPMVLEGENATASGVGGRPKPADWSEMSKTQRTNWHRRSQKGYE